jgi:GT2 family glycosyltransferase
MTRVMIAVPTGEFARRADFYDYYNMLEKPPGTICTFSHGQSPARNRNIMIEQALAHNCTHILFLDDDVAVRPTLLIDLLKHDKDMVSGLYLMRNYPHLPIMFDEAYSNGKCRYTFLYEGRKGLVEVVAAGLGACLIKTDVFRNMEKPWITLGELEKDHWCDDISFFLRAKKAGYQLYMDLDSPVGHFMTAVIWPNKNESGKWHTAYNTGAAEIFQVEQKTPSLDEIDAGLVAAGVK